MNAINNFERQCTQPIIHFFLTTRCRRCFAGNEWFLRIINSLAISWIVRARYDRRKKKKKRRCWRSKMAAHDDDPPRPRWSCIAFQASIRSFHVPPFKHLISCTFSNKVSIVSYPGRSRLALLVNGRITAKTKK